MTPDQADMVAFLRQQYADGIDTAHAIGEALTTQGALAHLGVSPAKAEDRAREGLHAAEARARFLEETVIPYLGTAGPMGRIADRQLQLLAWERAGARGYQEAWRP